MEWFFIGLIGLAIWGYATRPSSRSSLDKKQSFENKNRDHLSREYGANRHSGTARSLDDLGIRITTSSERQTKSKNKEPARWVQPGDGVSIQGKTISRGFVYVGGVLKGMDGWREASLIDPTLKADQKSPDYSGELMGYWPSYSEISPRCRTAYLDWLASDRAQSGVYIGYVFLYFYGIERRLLIDVVEQSLEEEEIKLLITELIRLRDKYGYNRSFKNYSNSLISHATVKFFPNQLESFSEELISAGKGFTSLFKYQLSNAVRAGDAINSGLAHTWVSSHPDFSLRTPARRCEKEFKTLFKLRYEARYGEGIKVKENKTKLVLDYHPASPTMMGYRGVESDLPDPSFLKGPVKKLMTIAESCTDELESYSRYLGRKGNSSNSIEAHALLPKDLAETVPNKVFDELKSWLMQQSENADGVLEVSEFLKIIGEDELLKINKKEAIQISTLAESAGFGIAPDIRFHGEKPELSGELVIFRKGHGRDFLPSSNFHQIKTIVRLGAMVAVADEHVAIEESETLSNLISDNRDISNIEKDSLGAYLKWRLKTPPNMVGIKTLLSKLASPERTAISEIVVGVALADGKVQPQEIVQLEKLYSQLGLDKALVTTDLHNLKSSNTTSLRENTSKIGKTYSDESSVGFKLDREFLKRRQTETKEVQSVLEAIFTEEELVENSQEQESSDIDNAASGLDNAHRSLYEKLISQEQWPDKDIQQCCKDLNLMMDGALEVINDWAFELVDAPIIENGDPIFVDLEIVNEINAL